MTMTAFAFDESKVHRDREGQFDDGIPGPSVKADRLKLAGRISLGPGERLHSSDRVAANGGGSALVAAVDGNAGRQVRLGAIADDKGAEKWRAANRGATANLNGSEARNTADTLDTVVRRSRDQALEAEIVGDALDDLDPDSPRFDELTARHDELTSGFLTGEQMVQSSWGDVAMGYSVDDVGIIRVVVGVRPDDSPAGWSLQDAWSDGDAVEMTPAQASRLAKKLATAAGTGAQTAAVDGMDEFAIPDQLADYWLHGKGAAKVRWCTRGAFRRARRLLRKYIPPGQLDGAVANLYHRACGRWPGRRGNEASAFAEMPAVVLPTEDAPGLEVAKEDATGVGYRRVDWSGPLAPIDIATGDRREFAEGALSTRQLPLPFRWQEKAASGHDGAVVVGSLTGYDIQADGTIWGRGYFLDPDVIPEVRKAMHLVEHGVVGPSVDLEPDMDVMPVDEDGEEFDPEQCQMDGDCPDKPRARITRATIAGATLVPITAFAEARAPQLTQAGHGKFCLWPLHPGPCKESSSGGRGSAGKKTGTDAGKKKATPAAEQTPAQAPGRGVVDALLREKFLNTPQTVNNDTTPEDRQADAERVAEQARVQQRREQRAKVRAQAQQARDRYGPRSKWPKRVKTNVEREEKRVSELASQTAATSLTACGCATRAGVSEFSVSTDGSTCACDPDGVAKPMSAGGEFCACAASQTAAVRDDFDSMPIASRDMAWDVGDAEAAISRWATNADGDIDFGRYARAFVYQDPDADPNTKGAYKFPVATVVDGELTIVPRAVFAAAGRLDQADVSADAREQIRETLTDLYDQMADEFDDDTVQAPWEMAMGDGDEYDELEHDLDASGDSAVDTYGAEVHGGEFCGTCGGDPLEQVAAAYGVFGDIPPHPIERFQRTASGPTPMTILEDGSVFGHIAPWDSCNRGVKGRCLPPPRSKTNYAQFHTVPVRTSEGTLRVGKIVMGEGHADVSGNMQVTRAWYDKAGKTVAHGRAHEDKWGVFFSGVIGPGVTPEQAVEFFSMPPSGHWTEHRPTRSSELIAVAAVNVQGHPVHGPDLVLNQIASGYFEPADGDVVDAAAVFAILDQADWKTEAAGLIEVFG